MRHVLTRQQLYDMIWERAVSKVAPEFGISDPARLVIPDIALPAREETRAPDRPTFIGHDWLSPAEAARPLSDRVACVDYSVAKGGPLMAYRYSGEATLTAENVVAL